MSPQPPPIEGVGTTAAGFVGQTVRGPIEPRLVTSWSEFQRWYGGTTDAASFLPYAVRGFFDNGGSRAYVARVAPAAARISRITLPTANGGNLVLTALGPGDLDDRLFAWVGPPRRRSWFPLRRASLRFRLVLLYYEESPATTAEEPDFIEEFDDLVIGPQGAGLSLPSALMSAVFDPSTAPSRPVDTGVEDGKRVYVPTAGGDSGIGIAASLPAAMTLGDFVGEAPTADDPGSGLLGLEGIEEVALLTVPDEGHSEVADSVRSGITDAVVRQCEQRRDRFGILQFPMDAGGGSPANVVPSFTTSHAAVYYPWLRVFDTAQTGTMLVPPGGHVAGAFARSDIENGVHRAPANLELRGIVTTVVPGVGGPLSVTVSRQDQEILNPRGVNVIRDFRGQGRGVRVWGARTLAADAEWKYVNVRRLFMFLEQSIARGIEWVAFEPNVESTWTMIEQAISNFLVGVWRSGGLMGAKQEEAFFVKCDRTTMTQTDIDNGRLVCSVGVATIKPAEFVIFRIGQWTGDAPT